MMDRRAFGVGGVAALAAPLRCRGQDGRAILVVFARLLTTVHRGLIIELATSEKGRTRARKLLSSVTLVVIGLACGWSAAVAQQPSLSELLIGM